MQRTRGRKFITAGVTFSVALGIGTIMQYGDALAARIGVDGGEPGPAPVQDLAGEAAMPATAPAIRVPAADPGFAGGSLPTDLSASPAVGLSVPGGFPDTAPQVPGAPIGLTGLDVPTAAPTLASLTPEEELPRVDLPAEEAVAVEAPRIVGPKIVSAVRSTTPAEVAAVPVAPSADDAKVAECGPTMTASPAPLAMVTLSLTDPCRPETRVTFHHQGMMFQVVTDDTGSVTLTVPALSRDALFIADFVEGMGAMATVEVPDLADYDRAVLQWRGDEGVQLHALEFGAAYGGPGHVWVEAAGDVQAAMTGTGGTLVRLGDPSIDPALMAEVYTFPTGQTRQSGTVALSVEAEVTPRNCGREVMAEGLQVRADGSIHGTDLVLSMPGCDAVGELLVLKNMLEDLTLAAR